MLYSILSTLNFYQFLNIIFLADINLCFTFAVQNYVDYSSL